jgi:hypothetical protein
VVGHRELPVGALDLNFGGRTGNSEDLIVIAFAVVAQRSEELLWLKWLVIGG